MAERSVVVRDVRVVDERSGSPVPADVHIEGTRIVAVSAPRAREGKQEVAGRGRLLLPGFVDAHSHAEAAVFTPTVQRALLRQGITSIVAGQDGVSFAPGGGEYARDYFGPLLGAHPSYAGSTVADLLRGYERTTPLNVAYLVPLGTVRYEVMGDRAEAPSARELAQMVELVRSAVEDGAVGASTGLDYFPGAHASEAEIVAMLAPVAARRGVYVTHMRHGYETNVGRGIAEVASICAAAKIDGHVSHLHGPLPLIRDALGDARATGIDLSFDSYPYARGCTLLALAVLPMERMRDGQDATRRWLSDPAARRWLAEEWLPGLAHRPDVGPEWADLLTIAGVDRLDYAWAQGKTLRDAAAQDGSSPEDFVISLLVDNALQVTAVMAVPSPRPWSELALISDEPGHMVGSDGIYVPESPHPRGWGTFARFLHRRTTRDSEWSVADAVEHLSARSARRFGLGTRGRVAPGWTADLILVDLDQVQDRADYERPTAVAEGIDDVFVGGELVLRDGELTGATPGRALRRMPLPETIDTPGDSE